MKKLLVLTMSIFLVMGCGNDDNDVDPGTAPDIPPLNTFLIDFDIVEANSSGRVAAMENWGWSVLNVGVWKAVITVTLAVPLASFATALEQDPTFNSDLPGWNWTYDVAAFSTLFNARLQAQLTETTVEWDMFLTNEGEFENFNWFSGSSALDGLSGTWTLNRSATDPTPLLLIEWTRAASGEIANVRYTDVSGGSGDGNFVFFEAGGSLEFDRDYQVYSAALDNTTEVQWNSISKNGQVKDPNRFGDEEYHCWDENLDDVDCPN